MSNAFAMAKEEKFEEGSVEAFKNVGKKAIVRDSYPTWKGKEVSIVGYCLLDGGKYLIKSEVGLNRWASEKDLHIIQ